MRLIKSDGPIDLPAEELLRHIEPVAERARARWADGGSDRRVLKREYESLHRLAASLMRSGKSPLPPLDGRRGCE